MKQKQGIRKNLDKKTSKNTIQNIAKYTGLSFQMLALVLLFVFGGKKLDEYLQLQMPIATLIMSLIGVALAIYVAIKDFISK